MREVNIGARQIICHERKHLCQKGTRAITDYSNKRAFNRNQRCILTQIQINTRIYKIEASSLTVMEVNVYLMKPTKTDKAASLLKQLERNQEHNGFLKFRFAPLFIVTTIQVVLII